jgi:hypothetical protein
MGKKKGVRGRKAQSREERVRVVEKCRRRIRGAFGPEKDRKQVEKVRVMGG